MSGTGKMLKEILQLIILWAENFLIFWVRSDSPVSKTHLSHWVESRLGGIQDSTGARAFIVRGS